MSSLTVCISGKGSTLLSLINAINQNQLPAKICQVVADRDCLGKFHAFNHTIPFYLLDRSIQKDKFNQQLINLFKQSDWVVLAGFLSVIDETVIKEFPNKIINIHPSLLPKYGGIGMYGQKVHQAVLTNKEKTTGATVHFVDSGVDTGKIIAQAEIPVMHDDTPQSIQQRLAPIEQNLLIEAIKNLI